jgi:hypothetical protein
MRELQPGDDSAYLFDREQVTRAYIQGIRNAVLAQMAGEWLQQYTQRFFLTMARDYQPIAGIELHIQEAARAAMVLANSSED